MDRKVCCWRSACSGDRDSSILGSGRESFWGLYSEGWMAVGERASAILMETWGVGLETGNEGGFCVMADRSQVSSVKQILSRSIRSCRNEITNRFPWTMEMGSSWCSVVDAKELFSRTGRFAASLLPQAVNQEIGTIRSGSPGILQFMQTGKQMSASSTLCQVYACSFWVLIIPGE